MTVISQGKLARWIEMGGIFAGIPVVLFGDVIPRYKIAALWIVSAACLRCLLSDRSFDRGRFRFRRFSSCPRLFIRLAIFTVGMALYTIVFEPQHFAVMLRNDPAHWGLIMILYPTLSVVPQELVYRVFFFHRYGSLFSSEKIMITTNAALFSFGHILFGNWIALAGGFVGGLLWADTYRRSGSLLVVSIEHALYGSLAFTIGIGRYFYSPDF
jgi:membrane protease YdiL (CAAX protease family)